ncbi:hypothetical protein DLJ53_14255 [Acuticoccus sediminis]|uniref:Uncharacterized protein n=1 Tax=Acuticoccus sediminis TaxID=2184697 RepID=A0A8B2NXB6_9HYPH|nr:hypothetical protein [Acuticoccus sediminis]RAI00428.1 hypothetical protein DLJ53_14255 [Acuticoccus sediminis]
MLQYFKVAAVAAALVTSTAAFAQTEADCEAAIRQTQADAENDGNLQNNDDKSDELATMLAEAGEAGIQGEYQKCLDMVRDARGAAGLSN